MRSPNTSAFEAVGLGVAYYLLGLVVLLGLLKLYVPLDVVFASGVVVYPPGLVVGVEIEFPLEPLRVLGAIAPSLEIVGAIPGAVVKLLKLFVMLGLL